MIWSTGAGVTTTYFSAADRCFERVFDTDDECDAFWKEIRRNSIDGICVNGVKKYMLRVLPYYTGYKDAIAIHLYRMNLRGRQGGNGGCWKPKFM